MRGAIFAVLVVLVFVTNVTVPIIVLLTSPSFSQNRDAVMPKVMGGLRLEKHESPPSATYFRGRIGTRGAPRKILYFANIPKKNRYIQ